MIKPMVFYIEREPCEYSDMYRADVIEHYDNDYKTVEVTPLIASAPDLLSALDELIMFYKEIDPDNSIYTERAIAISKKAKGE